MTHLIHPSLLLATIQLLFVPSESRAGVNVSLSTCSEPQIIEGSCSVNKARLKFWCEPKQNDHLKLTFKIISWNCDNQQASTCIPITIDYGDGETKTMCKKCCHGSQCPSLCRNSDCDHRSEHTVSASTSTVKITFEDSSCDLNVTKSPDNLTASSLEFFDDNKSWIRAFQDCYQMNSALVQITNQTVQNETISRLKDKSGLENGVWVGLERSIFGTDLDWMWTSGIKKGINPQWNISFPVDRLNHHCGKIIWLNKTNEIQLLDANCHEELPYICQDT